MKLFRLFALLVAILFSSATHAAASNHLVANKAEFDAAMDTAKAGDQIILKDGVWKDVKLTIDASGTSDKPLVVRAQTPGQTIISGSSSVSIGGDWVEVSGLSFKDGQTISTATKKGYIILFEADGKKANHSTVSNCSFDNYSQADPTIRDTFVGLRGTHNTVEYCYFGNKTNMGIYIAVERRVDQADHHHIFRNFFYRPVTNNKQANGQETIQIGTWPQSKKNSCTVVEENIFYQCNGEIEIISIKSCSNIIKNNSFVDCHGTITIRQGTNNTISGNYFIADGSPLTGGIRVTGKGQQITGNYFYGLPADGVHSGISMQMGYDNALQASYFSCRDIAIAGNTFVNCKCAMTFGSPIKSDTANALAGDTMSSPRDIKVVDCLVVSNVEGATATALGENCNLDGVEFINFKDFSDGKKSRAYKTEKATIAGITFDKVTAKNSKTTDITATPESCGPQWTGWVNPTK